MATALEQVRALYSELSQADQLSILVDLIQGDKKCALNCSDRFADALLPLDAALAEAWDLLTEDPRDPPKLSVANRSALS